MRKGDWLGDSEIVEILRADDGAKLTPLDQSGTSPGRVDGEVALSDRLKAIAGGILEMLENKDAGKGRVFFGPAEVLQLKSLADRLGEIAGELSTS